MTALSENWWVAYNRFGFGAGARGGDGDPRAALLAEIAAPDAALLSDAALRSTPEILRDVYADQAARKVEREKAAAPKPDAALAAGMVPANAMAAPQEPPRPQQVAFRADALARINRAISAPIGFTERLVAFWSNHFCVSAAKSDIGRAAAGAFEREAIRPFVLGRFVDMLKAVEKHPAMLNFLDNAQSVGPDSKAGAKNKTGLNENLAREIFELHSLGVGSGYSQTDVTQFARVITGWTISGRDGRLGDPGAFVFDPARHEPGPAKILGKTYAQEGVAQGEAVLEDLARHEATAKHVAFKLVRHFISDVPDSALVAHLTKIFVETSGDLKALAEALVREPTAWSTPPTKIRNPWELVIAASRALGRSYTDPGQIFNALNLLGMPLWQPPGPNGFSDETAAWASPEGMKTRVELAAQFARQSKSAASPLDVLASVIGAKASGPTQQAITRAESAEQAYALLLLAPEFQRR